MVKGGLSPKSIANYAQIVKMVVASATNEEGEQLYPQQWNHKFIGMPVVNKKKQRTPSFMGEVVTAVLHATKEEKYRVLFALCASTGLRFGEALGIHIKNISGDCSVIKIVEKAWGSAVQDFLKTDSGEREVDLHPSMAAMLREFIGDRKSGLLFASRRGNPLHQSSVLRRKLHPVLTKLAQPKCGVHAFRRFRNTWLRNYTSTPPGVLKFWMGHAGEDMSDLYDKIKSDVAFRKEVAEKAGLGFELPSKICVIGRNGRKIESKPVLELAASA
jgi:integrase